MVLLASRVRAWRQALLIVQPETLLRWHRQGFRLFWRRKSRAGASTARPKVAPETITLIKEMAAANRLWGAERIRGELLKLGIRVAKTTIQRYMRQARPPRHSGQTWATFLRTHATDIWACDFLPVTDLLFRQVYAFFIVELATRRVVHVGVTRHPTDAWVAQQLREATPFGQHPRYLIRDNDSKFGPAFARVAKDSGIEILRTAYRAPRMNAVCERFLGSVRRECLDHLLILSEAHLRRALRAYVAYFNEQRPHQGIAQQVPVPGQASPAPPAQQGVWRLSPFWVGCTMPIVASRDQPHKGRMKQTASTAIADVRGQRVPIYPDEVLRHNVERLFPLAIPWPLVGLPDTVWPLLAPEGSAFVSQGDRVVGHGGIPLKRSSSPLSR